jgi:hypothetical protein
VSRIAEMVERGVRVTVGDLPAGAATEIPADFFDAKELRPLGRSAIPIDVSDFAVVYEEAGVPAPFHEYGVDTMAEILESKRLASLPREVRMGAVMGSLEAAEVSLPQVLRDAVLRERALDAFVAAKEREVEAQRQRNASRIAVLKEEMESVVIERVREIENLRRGIENATSAFSQLQLRKRQEEARLHDVLSHFVGDSDNPVPVGGPNSGLRAASPAKTGS